MDWTESNSRFPYSIHNRNLSRLSCMFWKRFWNDGDAQEKDIRKTMFTKRMENLFWCYADRNRQCITFLVRGTKMDLHFMCGALKITEISVLCNAIRISKMNLLNSKVNIMHVLHKCFSGSEHCDSLCHGFMCWMWFHRLTIHCLFNKNTNRISIVCIRFFFFFFFCSSLEFIQ